MSNEQKLREALRETLLFCETFSNRWDGETGAHPFDMVERARQALATTEPAVNQQLTTEPFDEREAFEKWLGIKPCGAAHDFGWSAWQARAALAARKPLSDDQMWLLWNSQGVDDMNQGEAIAFARTVESAHGINDLEVKT